jgi:NAD-dependent SIR2 family protein deacetylase
LKVKCFKGKMAKIYCSKCKSHTNTKNEEWDEGRRLLSGECTKCGKIKITFTNEKGSFHQKSAKELEVAREKRKEATLNRRAKKLGREILDSENRKKVLRCVRKCLDDE